MRLPVFRTIGDGYRVAAYVGRRHLDAMAGFAVVSLLVIFVSGLLAGPPEFASPESIARVFVVALVANVAIAVTASILAVLTHNEVLVGPTSLRDVLGPGRSRLVGYFIDVFLLGLALAILGLVVFFVAWLCLLFVVVPSPRSLPAMLGISYLLLAVIGIPVASRLCMKLPSRAIGDGLTWRSAWTLGRGHTGRLCLVFVLGGVPMVLALLLLDWIARPLPELVAFVIGGIVWAAITLIQTSLLSACYRHLRDGVIAAATAAPPTGDPEQEGW